jgi:multiple sugar transport system substrate-binding protein
MKKSILSRSLVKLTLAGVIFSGSALLANAAPVTLNFWDMQWGVSEYAVAAQKIVDRYNQEHPDVHVIYRSVPWTNWFSTFTTSVASGSAPDLSTGAGFQAVYFFSQDAILPVDDLVKEIGEDAFVPGTLDACKYKGHYVGLPWGVDIRLWLYRKDILEAKGVKVPTNWDVFRAACKAVTGNGVYGYVSSGDSAGVHTLFVTAINNGGGLFTKDGKPALMSDRTMEALQFLADLVKDGSVNPASVGYQTFDRVANFFQGKAAFMIEGPNMPSQAGAAKDKIGILPPLKSPHGDVGTNEWINNIMVYKQTTHPKETFAFLKWWAENEKPVWTEGNLASFPAHKAFLQDPYFQNNPNYKYAIDVFAPIAKTIAAQKGGSFPELNEVDGDAAFSTLIQQLWQGKPLSEIVPPAQARLEEIMGH